MTFKVTHIDHHQRRRQLVLVCERRSQAEAQALLMFGSAHYLCVICMRRH